MKERLLSIIDSIRNSDAYIEHIYMRGGCYQFYIILKSIYPESLPYIHQDKDHVATKLFGNLYDIRGEIESKFECLYRPLATEDIPLVEAWNFSRQNVLQLQECPFCDEPLIYQPI